MSSDIVIVGAGAVGCLMAAKLCEMGRTVTLLEAGSNQQPHDYPHPQRDVFTNAGSVPYSLVGSRVKAVGGTTNHWGGYTPRFIEQDFRSRSVSGVGTDWPISYADLEPFYGQAEQEIGVSGNPDNDFAAWRSEPYPMPGRGVPPDLKERFAQIGIKLHSQPSTRITKPWRGRPPRVQYRARDVHLPRALATGRCKLIADATVTRLELDARGRVARAVYAGLADPTEKAAEAGLLVLGCGGIETPRLLLSSKSGKFPQGLANGSGLVGRFFMDHHRVDTVCEFASPLSLPFDRVQSSQFYPRQIGNPDTGLLLTFKALPTAADFVRQYYWGEALRERMMTQAATELLVGCTVEAIPSKDNFVDLDPVVKDAFGHPAPRITYSYSPEVRTALDRARTLVDRIAADLNPASSYPLGPLQLDHHMGTCRMSADPAEGVVDANLVAHGVPNLMVVGASVFVTGGCVNPTLSIATLALRAVNYIAGQYAA